MAGWGALPRAQPAHLDQQLAGAQDEASVGVAHTGGKLAKGAGVAGVRVGAKQHLTWEVAGRRAAKSVSRLAAPCCNVLVPHSWGQAGLAPRLSRALRSTSAVALPRLPGLQWPSCASATWHTPL